MSGEIQFSDLQNLRSAIAGELNYIRSLGSNDSLVVACANLSAYEALLIILSGDETGVPVYQAITNVSSRFSSQAGVLNRINALRKLGLLDEKPGVKKSQVCLVPSKKLIQELGPILAARHPGGGL